jgi:hypothetical protein
VDRRYIAAVREGEDSRTLLLFDIATSKWQELLRMKGGQPSFSHDGKYLYFDSFSNDPAIFRLGIGDRRLERLVSLKDVRRARRHYGSHPTWFGLAPDDSPLLLRDIGTQEVYALDWEAP